MNAPCRCPLCRRVIATVAKSEAAFRKRVMSHFIQRHPGFGHRARSLAADILANVRGRF